MPLPSPCATSLPADVDAARERLIAATQRLVAVASPNPPSDTHDVAAVAEALLREIPGIEVERIEPAPRVVSLVGRIKGARPGRRLIFNGHLDTFPIREDLAWTVPPLGGVLKDGKLYGRGVCDMKGGIACSLLAATLLAEHRDAWAGEIVLTLAGDEENMGSLGTGYMMEHIPHARGDANICGDVGSPRIVRFGEKGLMWVEVEATGSPAHGAHVHRGVNAIDRLRDALDRLKELEAIPFQAPPAVTAGHQQCQGDLGGAVGRGRSRHAARASPSISARSRAAPRPTWCRPMPSPAPTSGCRSASPPTCWRHKLDEWLGPLPGVTLARDPPLRALLHRARPRDHPAHRPGRRRSAGRGAGGEHAGRRLRIRAGTASTACRPSCWG